MQMFVFFLYLCNRNIGDSTRMTVIILKTYHYCIRLFSSIRQIISQCVIGHRVYGNYIMIVAMIVAMNVVSVRYIHSQVILSNDAKTYFALSVTPTQAEVMIDGVRHTLDDNGELVLRLNRGNHNIVIQALGYDTQIFSFDLGRDKMGKEVTLVSTMAQLSLQCHTHGAALYVNDQLVGNGTWEGSLIPGDYIIEVRKDGYHTAKQTVTLESKEKKAITIPALTARTGCLDINYRPINSEVYVDGQLVGTTPDIFNNIVIGKHKVRISKQGYTANVVDIDIAEGQTSSLAGVLGKLDVQTDTVLGVDRNLVVGRCSDDTDHSKTFTVNGITFRMVEVEGGTFMMGDKKIHRRNAFVDDTPLHKVTLSGYYIGQTEVTQELWQAVMGSNPSDFKIYNLPVEKVSWHDCLMFINRLNKLTGKHFRLPTEAEWEYACRGGKKSKGYKYSGSDNIDEVAWYKGNSGCISHPVATKKPNELGVYDMSGNVKEWCQDWYGSYPSKSQTNPTGPTTGYQRVIRSGNCGDIVKSCCSASRCHKSPDHRSADLGLRLVLTE